MVISCEDTAEILCTLDAVSMAAALDSTGFQNNYDVHIPIHVKIGMSTINLSSENYLSLYFLISAFNFVSFDFYENSSFKDRNIIVLILSILVDTFISKISLPMQPVPEIGSISVA